MQWRRITELGGMGWPMKMEQNVTGEACVSADAPAYHPVQPGYEQAGRRCFEPGYTSVCRLGASVSTMFEVRGLAHRGRSTWCPTAAPTSSSCTMASRCAAACRPPFPRRSPLPWAAQWVLDVRFLPGASRRCSPRRWTAAPMRRWTSPSPCSTSPKWRSAW